MSAITRMSALAWLGCFSLCACGVSVAEDETAEPDGGTQPPVGAFISGTISYQGRADGSLLIGLWFWDLDLTPGPPADGPPTGDFMLPIDNPRFPTRYVFDRLKSGDYFVGAVLDVGRNSPTLPRPEDVQAYSERITVEPGSEHRVDLVLLDPA